jgi:hypothetical protein
MMFKYYITYPHGQGGKWLSNVFYALSNDTAPQPPTNLNFHDAVRYPKSQLIALAHKAQDAPLAKFLGNFSSRKSQFIAYVNSCRKFRLVSDPVVANATSKSKLFYLSDDAAWRRGSDEFVKLYIDLLVIDADLMFIDTEQFAQQLFDVLEQQDIEHTADVDYVKSAVDNFKQTCQPESYLGNTNELIWLGWAHSILLTSNIKIPFTISDDLSEFAKFVQQHNDFIVDKTRQGFIVDV